MKHYSKLNLFQLLEGLEKSIASKTPRAKEIKKDIESNVGLFKLQDFKASEQLSYDTYNNLQEGLVALKVDSSDGDFQYYFFHNQLPFYLSFSKLRDKTVSISFGSGLGVSELEGFSNYSNNFLSRNVYNYNTVNHKDPTDFFKKVVFCVTDYSKLFPDTLFTFSGIDEGEIVLDDEVPYDSFAVGKKFEKEENRLKVLNFVQETLNVNLEAHLLKKSVSSLLGVVKNKLSETETSLNKKLNKKTLSSINSRYVVFLKLRKFYLDNSSTNKQVKSSAQNFKFTFSNTLRAFSDEKKFDNYFQVLSKLQKQKSSQNFDNFFSSQNNFDVKQFSELNSLEDELNEAYSKTNLPQLKKLEKELGEKVDKSSLDIYNEVALLRLLFVLKPNLEKVFKSTSKSKKEISYANLVEKTSAIALNTINKAGISVASTSFQTPSQLINFLFGEESSENVVTKEELLSALEKTINSFLKNSKYTQYFQKVNKSTFTKVMNNIEKKLKKVNNVTVPLQLSQLGLRFQLYPSGTLPKHIKEYESSPGALLSLTKKGQVTFLKTSRDKIYHRLLISYGVPAENVLIVSSTLYFKV